ncbi:nineteen complex-related protein 2-domain-containing protein [Suillus tomentosus]|nr:nineteen complex-related protein 2-domain-containing protein [Suillus tomentosus]
MSLDKETTSTRNIPALKSAFGLGKKSKKPEASKRKDAMHEMITDADEEDEETVEWEREQLRRGGPFPTFHEVSPTKQVYKAAAIPTSTTIPSLGPAMERLSQSLTAVTTLYITNAKAAAALVDEREQLESWFAAFKEWVENVATFLDEKFPKLEKLEDEFVLIFKEYSGMIARQRQADNQDDLSLIFGSLLAAADQSGEVDDLGRVLPRANPVTVVEAGALDSYSALDTRNMINLAQQVEASIGHDNPNSRCHCRPSPSTLPRVKVWNTLIQWHKFTGEKSGIDDLCTRHTNNVVLPIAESGWEVAGEEITREVIDGNVGYLRG